MFEPQFASLTDAKIFDRLNDLEIELTATRYPRIRRGIWSNVKRCIAQNSIVAPGRKRHDDG
jgi:hypothetical protein